MANTVRVDAPERIAYEEWRAWASEAQLSEWVDGEVIEFVPAQPIHIRLSVLLVRLLARFVERHDLGEVFNAPLEMRLARSAREPDVCFVATANLDRFDENRLNGPADLAVEIVSADSVVRDRIQKRAEYETAGVREYWILDPRPGRYGFELLALGDEGGYVSVAPDAVGRFHSVVLPGFWLDPAWFRREPLPKLAELTEAILAAEEAGR